MRAVYLLLSLALLGCPAEPTGDSTHAPATQGTQATVTKTQAKTKRPKKSVVACVAKLFRGSDDHGNSTSEASALAVGDAKTGRLEREADVDVFSIALEAGTRYDLSAHGFGRLRLVLLDVDGTTELARGTKGVKHRPTQAGLHFVRVENGGAQPQDYALEVLKAK